jgi:hypothetical protein
MASPNNKTISRLLSGQLSLDNITIGTFITRENTNNKNHVGEFTNIEYFSAPTNNVKIITDTGGYEFSNSAYVSAYKTTFNDINTDYANENVSFCTFVSGVNLNSSYILTQQDIWSPSIVGNVNFNFSNSQILRLRDYSDSYNLFRKFRERLLKNQLGGNIQNLTIKLALLNTTYSHNIESEFYSSISSKVVTSTTIPGIYIDDNSLRTTTPFIKFNTVTGATISDAVFYIDTGNPSTSVLIGWYGPDVLNNVPYTPTGESIYFAFNNKTLFSF